MTWFQVWLDQLRKKAPLATLSVILARSAYQKAGLTEAQSRTLELVAVIPVVTFIVLMIGSSRDFPSVPALALIALAVVLAAELARSLAYAWWIKVRQNPLDDVPERWS